MDYSASIHETDDPAGASPWGHTSESSPHQSRSDFGNTSQDAPSFPYSSQLSSNGLEETGDGEESQRPGTATTTSGTDGELDDSTTLDVNASESAGESQHGFSGQQTSEAPPHQHPGGESQREQGQQSRKPAQPQFRLQAKITGLERTGKKDPILRFDVHVSPWSSLAVEISG